MNQVLAIQKVQQKITKAITGGSYSDPKATLSLLKEIQNDLQVFLDNGIDFKIVVDSLDDSIYITDKEGKVLYVNPAHEKNTDIRPEEVLGKSTQEIVSDGSLFTGGATMKFAAAPIAIPIIATQI